MILSASTLRPLGQVNQSAYIPISVLLFSAHLWTGFFFFSSDMKIALTHTVGIPSTFLLPSILAQESCS